MSPFRVFIPAKFFKNRSRNLNFPAPSGLKSSSQWSSVVIRARRSTFKRFRHPWKGVVNPTIPVFTTDSIASKQNYNAVQGFRTGSVL